VKPDPSIILSGVAAMYAAASRPLISADDVLISWSIVGAVGGALISSLLTKDDSFRQRIAKFIASAVAGFIFTPLIMEWRNWDVSPDSVMGASATIAFLSWGLLQVVMKLGPILFKQYLHKKIEPYIAPARRTNSRRKKVDENEYDA